MKAPSITSPKKQIPSSHVALACLLFTTFSPLALGDDAWTIITSANGKHIRVYLLGGNDTSISFKRGGKEFKDFPLNKLSPESQKRVKALVAKINADNARIEAWQERRREMQVRWVKLDPPPKVEGDRLHFTKLRDLRNKGKEAFIKKHHGEYQALKAISQSSDEGVNFDYFHQRHKALLDAVAQYASGKIKESSKVEVTMKVNELANTFKLASVQKFVKPYIASIAFGGDLNFNQTEFLLEIYKGPIADALVSPSIVSHNALWDVIETNVSQIKKAANQPYTNIQHGSIGSTPKQFESIYGAAINSPKTSQDLIGSWKHKVTAYHKLETKTYEDLDNNVTLDVYFCDGMAFQILYSKKSNFSANDMLIILGRNGANWGRDGLVLSPVADAEIAKYCGISCIVINASKMLIIDDLVHLSTGIIDYKKPITP